MVAIVSPYFPHSNRQIADVLVDYPEANGARLRELAYFYERYRRNWMFANNLRLAAKHREWLDNNADGWSIFEALDVLSHQSKVKMIEFPNDTDALLYKLSM